MCIRDRCGPRDQKQSLGPGTPISEADILNVKTSRKSNRILIMHTLYSYSSYIKAPII